MKLGEIRWLYAFGGVLAAEAVLIAAAFGWVAIYSYGINPGQTLGTYQAYAERVSPYVALILGIPVFFAVSRWISLRTPSAGFPTAMALFGIYCLIEIPLMLPYGGSALPAWFAPVNFLTKFLACYGGSRSVRRPARHPA